MHAGAIAQAVDRCLRLCAAGTLILLTAGSLSTGTGYHFKGMPVLICGARRRPADYAVKH
jgi:hypothetical protein